MYREPKCLHYFHNWMGSLLNSVMELQYTGLNTRFATKRVVVFIPVRFVSWFSLRGDKEVGDRLKVSGVILLVPAGRGGEPWDLPVSGEPERPSPHGPDEEAWRPQDRVSPAPDKITVEVFPINCLLCVHGSSGMKWDLLSGRSITSPWWNGPPAPNWPWTGWTEHRTTRSSPCVKPPQGSAPRWPSHSPTNPPELLPRPQHLPFTDVLLDL